MIDQVLVSRGVITGNMGNLLRAMVKFIHQALVHLDANLYTIENIEEGLCRHPELTARFAKPLNISLILTIMMKRIRSGKEEF